MSFKLPLFNLANERFSADGDWYCGIDFANDVNELGVCLVRDDAANQALVVHSVVARPPVTHGTMQLIRDLLLVEGILDSDARGICGLPQGQNVRQAKIGDLLASFQAPVVRQRLVASPNEAIAAPRSALLRKLGYDSDAISQDVLSQWDFLFDAVPKFGRPTHVAQDEQNRVRYIIWLVERTLAAEGEIQMFAVDSPLGTNRDFADLLRGEIPEQLSDRKLKERATERFWRKRLLDIARHHPETTRYFDQNSHLKSSVGLEIVPEAIYCVQKAFGKRGLRDARIGSPDARMIEAAPRVFLYTIIERIRRSETQKGRAIDPRITESVKQYKSKEGSDRGLILDFVLEHFRSWSGGINREFRFAVDKEKLIADNHLFDAWLAAMTAWAFCQKQTLNAKDAGLTGTRLELEGHIVALR